MVNSAHNFITEVMGKHSEAIFGKNELSWYETWHAKEALGICWGVEGGKGKTNLKKIQDDVMQ